jgi:hypothetical protein
MTCETCGHWYANSFCEILWRPHIEGTCYLYAKWSMLDWNKEGEE